MARAVQETLVRVGSDISEALEGLNQVGARAQKLSRDLSRTGRSMSRSFTAPVLAAGAAAFGAALRVSSLADDLSTLSAQTGLTTDSLQEYRRVATIAGADQDAVADAAMRLTRRMKEVGGESKAVQETLGRLGVSVRDSEGNLRSMDDVLPEIIEAFQGIEDVTRRNSLAVEVFGRGAARMAPILGLTAEEFRAARAEAHELGLVLDGEALDAADAFRVELTTLRETAGAMVHQIGVAVLPVVSRMVSAVQDTVVPALQRFSEWLRNVDQDTLALVAAVGAVVAAIGPMVVIGAKVVGVLAAIASPAGLVVAALAAVATTAIVVAKNWDVLVLQGTLAWTALKRVVFDAVDGILGMLERLTSRIPVIGKQVSNLRRNFSDFATDSLAKSGARIYELERGLNDAGAAAARTDSAVRSASTGLDMLASSTGAATGGTDRIAEALARHEAQLRAVEQMAALLGDGYDATGERARTFASTLEALVGAGLDATDERVIALRDGLADLRAEVEQTTQRTRAMDAALRDAEQITQALRTPAEVYADEVARLTEHLEAGRISQDTFSRGLERAAEGLEKAGEKAQGVGGEFRRVADRGVDAFADFATGAGGAISDFVRGAIRDLARLAVRMAAMRLIGAAVPGGGVALGALSQIPGRATGGPVTAGRPYWVGERGPELVVPRQSATVVPNHALPSGGDSTAAAILDRLGPPPQPISPHEAATHRWYRELIAEMVPDYASRGGRFG